MHRLSVDIAGVLIGRFDKLSDKKREDERSRIAYLLRQAIPNDTPVLDHLPNGRPILSSTHNISISHTGQWGAIYIVPPPFHSRDRYRRGVGQSPTRLRALHERQRDGASDICIFRATATPLHNNMECEGNCLQNLQSTRCKPPSTLRHLPSKHSTVRRGPLFVRSHLLQALPPRSQHHHPSRLYRRHRPHLCPICTRDRLNNLSNRIKSRVALSREECSRLFVSGRE